MPNSSLFLLFPCYENDRVIICENAPGDTALLVCGRLRSESRITEGKATQSFWILLHISKLPSRKNVPVFAIGYNRQEWQLLPTPFITLGVSIVSNLNVIVLLYVFPNTICIFFPFSLTLGKMQIVKLPAFELESLPLEVQKVVSKGIAVPAL